jgi:hypothetical protein
VRFHIQTAAATDTTFTPAASGPANSTISFRKLLASGPLAKLAERFVRKIGTDAFFDLM